MILRRRLRVFAGDDRILERPGDAELGRRRGRVGPGETQTTAPLNGARDCGLPSERRALLRLRAQRVR
jgi:hypothetical protein